MEGSSRQFHVRVPRRTWVCFTILTFVNIMSYADRFLLSVVLSKLKKDLDVRNTLAGLLQTAFFILYVPAVPIFGYLGDRYNRQRILIFSVLLWNVCNFGNSFVTSYWLFFCIRAIFGVGHAGHSTIAPIIIGDLFIGNLRTKMLTIFYLAIPTGMGLGYVVGKQVAFSLGWRWTMRVTPVIGAINVVVILVALKEPVRGEIEGKVFPAAFLLEDLRYLGKNKTFILSSLAFLCISFTAQALAWWGPHLLDLGVALLSKDIDLGMISSVLGIVTLIGGTLGAVSGYFLSYKLKKKFPQVDPIICGMGLFVATPLLIAATFLTTYSVPLCFLCLFLAQLAMSINWALIIDILLKVVLPNKRALALGVQLFLGHGFGSLFSPYVVGIFTDSFENMRVATQDEWNEFRSLQFAFFVACSFEILGGVLLLLSSLYIMATRRGWKVLRINTEKPLIKITVIV